MRRGLYKGRGAWYSYCMAHTVIYGLIDPRTTEVRYVGKTSGTVPRRIAGHYKLARTKPSLVGNWLLKLEKLGLKPLWTVLEEAPADWQTAERKWIAYYRALYPGRMKNVADGGEGGWTGAWDHASRADLTAWGRLGAEAMQRSPNRRVVIPTIDDAARAKISAVHKGKPKSEEWKAKIRATAAAKRTAS